MTDGEKGGLCAAPDGRTQVGLLTTSTLHDTQAGFQDQVQAHKNPDHYDAC